MTTNDDIRGHEYDWLAVDADGVVGFFSTAGGGYAPEAFLEDIDAFDSAITTILSLPATTSSTCVRELPPGHTNTWRLMADRGLFAFDSDPLGGPYRLIAAPHQAIAPDSLPSSVRLVLERLVLPSVTFKTAKEVTETQIRR
jgi:hypothetical protein